MMKPYLMLVLLIPDLVAAQGSDSVRVREVALGIIDADNERALHRVLNYYATDAVLLPPNAPAVMGREKIQLRYEALFRDFTPAIKTRIDELIVVGDLSYVRGHNDGLLVARGKGMIDRELNDDYVMFLRRSSDGAWRITCLIWYASSK